MATKKKKQVLKECHSSVGVTFLVGREIRKEFKGFGTFSGRIADFHRDTGYRIEYEDGDSEDLTEAGVIQLLAEGARHPVEPCEQPSNLSKASHPPAVQLSEFIAHAQRAARRKRKHTELKRSGVFERKRQAAEAKREAAALEEAARLPLHPPPAWAEGMAREGRAVRCEGAPEAPSFSMDHDTSLYRLRLTPLSSTATKVEWWFPPANPGNSGAWIGLFAADSVVWGVRGEAGGEVGSGDDKIAYRLITKNGASGFLKFTLPKAHGGKPLPDGHYLFTLQADYGRKARAVSERFKVVNGRIAEIYEGSLHSDHPSVSRKNRQQNAALNLLEVSRSAAVGAEAEVIDERCYFPVTNCEFTLAERYQEEVPILKRVYTVVDKASFLDWGLTSDYKMDAVDGEHKLRDRKAASDTGGLAGGMLPLPTISTQYSNDLPSAAQYASRKSGINGSEGYGEATIGSAQKIGLLLMNLRHLVLHDLHDSHWGLLFDLGPHSTFLDIGSGYGKVVFHLKLLSRMRRAVGLECVASRDEIAKQALFQLEAEVDSPAARMPLATVPVPAQTAPASQAADANQPEGAAKGGALAVTAGEDTSVAAAPGRDGGDAGATGAGTGSSTALTSAAAPAADAADAPDVLPRMVRSGLLDGVEFEHGDATIMDSLPYTHIYIFDWVFSQHTLKDLAKVLQRSDFYILCSFRKVTEWWSFGLGKIQPVAKLPGFKTTGGEGMTCYVYVNVEKVPQ